MPPIILIHGFPFDAHMWDAQAAFLRSADGGEHNVIVPDLPGFGESKVPAPEKSTASMESYAETVHKEIISLGGKAIVAGLSMGGYILLALLREHPESVAAAMLLDTRPDPDSSDARSNRLKMIEEMEKDPDTAKPKAIETLLTKVLGKRPSEAAKRETKTIMERQSPQAIIAAQFAMSRRRDHSDLLAELKIPTLILVGAEDTITPPSIAIHMQTLMPHAMLVQIVNSGHMTTIEQPTAVNAAMKAFLSTIK